MKAFRVILTIILALLFTQAVFSDFVRTIGPSYLINTSGVQADNNKFCPPQNQIPPGSGECVINCPANNGPLNPQIKGFPFQRNDFYDECGYTVIPYKTSDFTLARVLDYTYLGIITLVLAILITKQISPTLKSKKH